MELAKVYNTKAVELISVALGHMAEAATEESFNENISSWTMENWEAFTTKSRGSLMANSCQAAILVSGHDEKVNNFLFYNRSFHLRKTMESQSLHNINEQ